MTTAALARRRLLITFSIFVLLGLPEGIQGTAWPSIRTTFGQPVSNLASVITAYTLGYLLGTVSSGRMSEVFGPERALRLGVSLTLAGLLGYLFSPAWIAFVISALILGAGAGTVDSVINADVALRYGPRVMHLLHAFFGVGATLGPLLVTVLLQSDVSWRVAYGLLVVIEASLLAGLVALRAIPPAEIQHPVAADRRPSAARPGMALAATLAYFCIYVATEVSIGQWSFSVLTESRSYSTGAAGLAVAGYWAGLTVGRLALGVIDRRLRPETLLRGAVATALAASVWFWAALPGSGLALAVLGIAFAGIFPSLVLLTPHWLGRDRVVRAVGYQLAASSGGAIVASFVLAEVAGDGGAVGLSALPGAFVVMVVLLGSTHVFTEWATRGADRTTTDSSRWAPSRRATMP